MNGLAAAFGSLVSGWIADRHGRYIAFFGSGLIQAGVAILLLKAPRSPFMFGLGILLYATSQGGNYGAFSALVFHVAGSRAVATKYAILTSLGYVPISYMTTFDGFAHDRWGTAGMLLSEASLGVAFTALALFALWRVRRINRAPRLSHS
ncbi:MAG TPA: hypothetical protein VH601_04805 [Bryobacteraceae bacterium]